MSEQPMKKEYAWHYEEDGGGYSYFGLDADNLEDAIKEAKQRYLEEMCGKVSGEGEPDTVWVGECVLRNPENFTVDADSVLDNIAEQSYEEFEDGNDWIDSFNNTEAVLELQEQLSEVFWKWCRKYNLSPNYGIMQNVKEYKID